MADGSHFLSLRIVDPNLGADVSLIVVFQNQNRSPLLK